MAYSGDTAFIYGVFGVRKWLIVGIQNLNTECSGFESGLYWGYGIDIRSVQGSKVAYSGVTAFTYRVFRIVNQPVLEIQQ